MSDLVSDQEHRNQLLTEADYSATGAVDPEIASLQPLSETEIKVQIRNEWNVLRESKSSDFDEDSCFESSSCQSCDSARRDSSFQSACWGNHSTATSDEFASLRASPIIEGKGTLPEACMVSHNSIVDTESDFNSAMSNFTDCPATVKRKEETDSVSKLHHIL